MPGRTLGDDPRGPIERARDRKDVDLPPKRRPSCFVRFSMPPKDHCSVKVVSENVSAVIVFYFLTKSVTLFTAFSIPPLLTFGRHQCSMIIVYLRVLIVADMMAERSAHNSSEPSLQILALPLWVISLLRYSMLLRSFPITEAGIVCCQGGNFLRRAFFIPTILVTSDPLQGNLL